MLGTLWHQGHRWLLSSKLIHVIVYAELCKSLFESNCVLTTDCNNVYKKQNNDIF